MMLKNIRLANRVTFCVLVLLIQGACAAFPASQNDEAKGAYVLAKLESVEDIASDQNRISIDGAYRLKFVHKVTLFGSTEIRRYYYTRESAKPVSGRDYYILITPDQAGAEVVWASPASLGFCDGRETAAELGVQLAYQNLERQYPCRK